MFGSYLLDWLFGRGGYIGGILVGGDGVYYGRAVYMFIMYLYDGGYEGDDGGEDFCFNLFSMGNVGSYIDECFEDVDFMLKLTEDLRWLRKSWD